MKRVVASVVAVMLMGVWGGTPAPAEQEGWNYAAYLYGWLPQMSGDVGVGRVSVPVDASFSDTADLIKDIKGAAMLHAEARNAPYAVLGDLYYLNLDVDGQTPVGSSSVELKQAIAELAGAYTLPIEAQDVTVEVLGGGRYENLDVGIDINAVGVNADGSESWVDPFVGARAAFAASPAVTLSLRGDVGGFGVGSDLSWNVVAAAQWAITDLWSLAAGYRILDVDYDHDGFVYDVRTDGPEIGIGCRF